MDIPPLKKRSIVSKTRSYKEEEALIKLWPSYECLYKITSADYKRNEKRAAAVEAIKRALETIRGGNLYKEETFTLTKPHFVTPSCLVAKPLIKITAIFVVCISLHSNRGENRTEITA